MANTNSRSKEQVEAKILIVDDEPGNIAVLRRMLAHAGYHNLKTTTNGREVTDIYLTYSPDLILLDLKMPGFNGFEVMKDLKKFQGNDYLPILILTAQRDSETRLRALESGAKDFVNKPFDATEILARIGNMLEVRLLHNQVRDNNKTLEEKILERTYELEKTRMEVIHRLGRAAEFRDNETGLHVIRMSRFSQRLAQQLGLPDSECDLILNASPMHDIGKIGIPDRILLKPGKLTYDEWEIMKKHSEIGAKLLSGSKSPLIQMAEEIALTHQERWDGSGYPQGLKGEEIPLVSRVVAVADVFDALTSDRPYKKAWPVEDSANEIISKSGILFDPKLVASFKEVLPDFISIKEAYADNDETSILYHLQEKLPPLQTS